MTHPCGHLLLIPLLPYIVLTMMWPVLLYVGPNGVSTFIIYFFISIVAQFMYIIRRRINLPSEKAMFLFVNKVLPTTRYDMVCHCLSKQLMTRACVVLNVCSVP